jgi:uncharacterized protein YcfL
MDNWRRRHRYYTIKMMGKYLIILLSLFFCFACNKEEEVESKYLEVVTNTNQKSNSRALIDTPSFGNGTSMGIWLTNSDNSSYMGKTYANYKYTANGIGASQKWSTETAIKLSAKAGKVMAIYPYSSSATDYAAIPIEAASQTDYMWGSATGVSTTNNVAILNMKHLFTCIRLQIKKGNYTGTGSISAVSINGNNLATNATVNISSGVIKCTGINAAITRTGLGMTLSESVQYIDVLGIPTGTYSPITIKVTIDGNVYPMTTNSILLSSGTIHPYTINMDNPLVEYTDWVTNSLSVTASTTAVAATGGSATLYCEANQTRNRTVTTQGTATTTTESQTVAVTPTWSNSGSASLSSTTATNPTVSFANNTTSSARSTSATATYAGKTGSVTISQSAGGSSTTYTFTFSNGSGEYDKGTVVNTVGSFSTSITTTCVVKWNGVTTSTKNPFYSVQSKSSWITVSGSTISYSANTGSYARDGEVVFVQSGSRKTITAYVTQNKGNSVIIQ